MSLIEPPIKVEVGRITITTGFDADGDILFDVGVEGNIPYVQALGLLEAAKHSLDELSEDDD
ncbi:hypothetical protein [Corynebacterium timonense]|uniref:Uncharacterized protein n=1 Tax=Corynebacterium timonense TaxID=441500 RepID=A0A1H1LRK6_9CORY|nr:hypothetical protein [Corynebacterium timonense]SDR76952.1 hypothetical protein SAMN04488539_0306 [Corynebacterium timonense]